MQVGVSEAIGTIIDAIDSAEFLDLTMRVMDRVVPSDLLCLLVHGPKGAPATLFENFQDHGWREGLQRYLALTYEIDPFYVACRRGSRHPPPPQDRHHRLARRGDRVPHRRVAAGNGGGRRELPSAGRTYRAALAVPVQGGPRGFHRGGYRALGDPAGARRSRSTTSPSAFRSPCRTCRPSEPGQADGTGAAGRRLPPFRTHRSRDRPRSRDFN